MKDSIFEKGIHMRSRIKLLGAVVLLASLTLSVSASNKSVVRKTTLSVQPGQGLTAKQSALREAMRKLWEDHITWTRLFIISAVADLPDKAATTERLLQNQVDIGNAIKTYYGDAAGEKLTALLKEHIITAAELVAAANAGDTAKMEDTRKRWYANANEIANFLSGANPKAWPPVEMKHMMHEHLDMTTAEVVARLKGDWAGDVKAYENIHGQILQMADMLSEGIISQFPKKFA
jgi:hypothetical protein